MLEGISYLHAKFQINILRNKKVIKLLELWTLWLKKRKEKKRKEKNSKYNRVVFTTLKRRKKENSEYKRVVITTLKIWIPQFLFVLQFEQVQKITSAADAELAAVLTDQSVSQERMEGVSAP